jgi:prepilin-type N-terminal cleavage/methylation domain-containing protein
MKIIIHNVKDKGFDKFELILHPCPGLGHPGLMSKPARPEAGRRMGLAVSRGECRQRLRAAGFTMIEVALCLAILGFALAAIIGVLPTGMRVQQTNRNDTIINEDANYFMEAIRNGAQGLDVLTNNVDWIRVTNNIYPNGIGYSNFVQLGAYSGRAIIGLLSTPKWYQTPAPANAWRTNAVVAKVRALSGSIAERNALSRDVSFSYLMRVEITPAVVAPVNPNTNFMSVLDQAAFNALPNLLYEVRLTLRWPVRPDGTTGEGFQVYRSLVSSAPMVPRTTAGLNPSLPVFFFQPLVYARQ